MSRSIPRSLAALACVVLAVVVAGTALASGGGGHDGGELHINWFGMDPHAPAVGWLLIDFAIFLVIIVVLGRKPLTEFLKGRALKIQKALDEARQAKAAAEARAAELEQRLKDLDKEIGGLREDIQRMGERERAQLEQDGQKAAARLAQDTEAQIASELGRAREQLKAEAAALAMQLAENQLRSTLGAADYRRLNAEFVAGFERPQGKEVRP